MYLGAKRRYINALPFLSFPFTVCQSRLTRSVKLLLLNNTVWMARVKTSKFIQSQTYYWRQRVLHLFCWESVVKSSKDEDGDWFLLFSVISVQSVFCYCWFGDSSGIRHECMLQWSQQFSSETRYWYSCLKADVQGATPPSVRSPVEDEERMKPGHLLR